MAVLALHESVVGSHLTQGAHPHEIPSLYSRFPSGETKPQVPKDDDCLTAPETQQHERAGCRVLPGSFTSALKVRPETHQHREVAVKSAAGTTTASGCLRHSQLHRGWVEKPCGHRCAGTRMSLGHPWCCR